mmetsp:Transcript_41296/g.162804  ORF Transcript_41296/g.162804 Transcript_41296/m.162804 type:complete len:96 (+) Transcript_41296:585-872(+)
MASVTNPPTLKEELSQSNYRRGTAKLSVCPVDLYESLWLSNHVYIVRFVQLPSHLLYAECRNWVEEVRLQNPDLRRENDGLSKEACFRKAIALLW